MPESGAAGAGRGQDKGKGKANAGAGKAPGKKGAAPRDASSPCNDRARARAAHVSVPSGPRDDAASYDRMRSNVMDELKKSFRPEFLNRIDEVIVFHTLTQNDVKKIVDLMMKRVEDQLKSKDIDIELTDAAKSVLAEKGYDQALGARPLRRTIQRLVEDPLAEKLLYKEYRAGETVVVDAVDGEIVFDHAGGLLPPDVPPVELAGTE